MLLEAVVSTAIVVVLLGAVLSLVDPAQGAVAAQPQAAEMQQRARAAFAEMHRDLLMAGSGMGAGSRTALGWLRAPVAPGRIGGSTGHAGRPEDDAFTLFHAPPGVHGAHLDSELPADLGEVHVSLAPGRGCNRPPRCGVDAPGNALVFDARGRSELFRIVRARGSAVRMRRFGADAGAAFPAGAWVVPVTVRGYALDRRREQLRRLGGTAATLPFLDGVVDLTVRFFGGPLPVLTPASSVDEASGRLAAPCLVAAAGGERTPGAAPSPVRELTAAELTDGPWCGSSQRFDIDLFRVRRVRIAIRLRVPEDAWRGRELLAPGPPGRRARAGAVPDLTVRFDAAPRGLTSW